MEALIHGILLLEAPAVQNSTVTSATEGNLPSKGPVVKKLTMEMVKDGIHPLKDKRKFSKGCQAQKTMMVLLRF